MDRENEVQKEGHTREWQDRARVVIDAKEAAGTEASPKQSPLPGDDVADIEKNDDSEADDDETTDSVY